MSVNQTKVVKSEKGSKDVVETILTSKLLFSRRMWLLGQDIKITISEKNMVFSSQENRDLNEHKFPFQTKCQH